MAGKCGQACVGRDRSAAAQEMHWHFLGVSCEDGQVMKTITDIGPTESAYPASCLECEKPLPVSAPFAVKVTRTSDGTVEGYLHPLCQANWEKNHPGFEYVRP